MKNKMEHQKTEPVLGLKKFYKDEFDAFEKYYDKIQSSHEENSALNIIKLADQLPFLDYCELADEVAQFPRRVEQNETPPEIQEPNKSIEFAHASLKLAKSHQKGRQLVTTKDLERGDLIISEKVTVLVVDPACICTKEYGQMYRCHHCAYALTKFYTCTTCNIVIYCSVDCLVKSYNAYHRFECEAFQRHYWKLDRTDNSYVAFRMMLYGAHQNFNYDIPEHERFKWGSKENNYPYIYRLETHFQDLPVAKVYEILNAATKIILYLLVRTTFFKEFVCKDQTDLVKYVGGLLVKHYCQAQINCVLVRYPNLDEGLAFNITGNSGKAICPTIAMLNHSCSPNAVIIPFNDRLVVRTLKPIPADTEITIAYPEMNPFLALADRQLIMREYFYFPTFCQCSFCVYEMTWQEYPYKCQKCKKGRAKKLILENGTAKLFCKDCKQLSNALVKAEKIVEIAADLYKKTSDFLLMIRMLENYNDLFPWDSWMMLDAYKTLYQKYDEGEEKPLETIKYGLMYFSVLDQYLPKLYPPCLEARIRFYRNVIHTDQFRMLLHVTAEEYDSIRYFIDDCLKTKRDLLMYVPQRYTDYYIVEVIKPLENIQFNLRIITDNDAEE